MDESILANIKKLLGPECEYTHFDPDLILFINEALSELVELGVDQLEGYKIQGYDEKWTDITDDITTLGFIREFVYVSTKLVFDPPQNSTVLNALKDKLDKLEYRINTRVDRGLPNE